MLSCRWLVVMSEVVIGRPEMIRSAHIGLLHVFLCVCVCVWLHSAFCFCMSVADPLCGSVARVF